MNSTRRLFLLKAFKTFDIINLCFFFFLMVNAFSHQNYTFAIGNISQIEIEVQQLIFLFFTIFSWHLVFCIFGLYHSKRLEKQRREIVSIIKATSIGIIVIYLESLLFEIDMLTPAFMVIFWVVISLSTVFSRLVMRYVLSKIRAHGRNLRFMLIVGTNKRAIQFAKKIISKPELGYRIIGFIDNELYDIDHFQKTGCQLVCDFDNFITFVREHVVDEIVIALPIKSFYDIAFKLVSICEEQGIVVKHLSNIFDNNPSIIDEENIDVYHSTGLYNGIEESLAPQIKRMMDITLSLSLLILLLPIFVLTAIAIKFTSPGPVFFIQERMGLNKRKFCLYKFRTMIPEAERIQSKLEHLNELSGPVFKITNDPRITRVGKFLRKLSVDELPQLLNVLKGDMSLVGPRPLPIRDFAGFNEDWQRRRFSVRPGITCLWQVMGRNSISFDKWMELDLEYIDHWSIVLDIKILMMTITAVLRGSGAS